MRCIKEVLRLYFEEGRAKRQIAQSVGVSPTTLGDYIQRAQVVGIVFPLPPGMNDDAWSDACFPPAPPVTLKRGEPDWPAVYAAMSRKGMTLTLAWQEYKRVHPDGYPFSWFCEVYRRYGPCRLARSVSP